MSAAPRKVFISRVLPTPLDAGQAVPAVVPKPPAAGTVIFFPEPVSAWLAVVAAHDRVTMEDFLVRCIVERMESIGLSKALDLLEAPRAPP